jgi:hypothetical protein
MDEEEIHCVGVLADVDSSLCKLKLRHGFKIQTKPAREIQDIISLFHMFHSRYDRRIEVLTDKGGGRLQVVTNIFHVWGNEEGYFSDYEPEGPDRDDAFLVSDYLEPVIRLMKLFKDGDPRIEMNIYYTMEDGTPAPSSMDSGTNFEFNGIRYSLSEEEVRRVQALIDETKLPFKRGFLNLAFDFYELSLTLHNMPLAFLSLMIGLEVLFNPGGHGFTKKISNYASRLLADREDDREKLRSDIYNLYDKRSRLVHDGIYDTSSNYIKSVRDYYHPTGHPLNDSTHSESVIEFSDLLRLREYLRRSIMRGVEIDKEKADFLRQLS